MVNEFPLKRILTLSESEKKQLESEYQVLYQSLEKIADELINLMNKKEKVQEKLQEKMGTSLSIDKVQQQFIYINHLDQSIQNCKEQYESARERVDYSKNLLTEKAIQVKKYEKLQDRHLKNWKETFKKRDLMKMDEAASLKFVKH